MFAGEMQGRGNTVAHGWREYEKPTVAGWMSRVKKGGTQPISRVRGFHRSSRPRGRPPSAGRNSTQDGNAKRSAPDQSGCEPERMVYPATWPSALRVASTISTPALE